MTPTQAIALALLLPVGGALGVLLSRRHANLREAVTVATALATFGTVAWLTPRVAAGGRPGLTLCEPLPGIALAFELEPLGMLFALVASGLWIVTSVYAIGYLRGKGEKNQTRFFVCFALAIASALGIAFARNLLTLFLFYELLTLSTFPLVTHHGTAKAMRAGRVYLGVLMSTSIALLLTAIIWTYHLAGTLELRPGGILAGRVDGVQLPILMLLFAFGAGKAALMPFHRWLPAAMVAPTPVSALLHAVAVVKAGVFTVLKVVVYIFGIDLLHDAGAGDWVVLIAALTIVIGSLVALTKDNLKARLAYSTVSQLGYVVLGAALATPVSIAGSALHIAVHALGKITLFFCAGAIYVTAHKTEISQLDGLGRRMPITFGAFFLGAAAIVGIPPFSMWSKFELGLGSTDGIHEWYIAVLMASSLLSIAYLMPIVARGFFLPPRPAADPDRHDRPEHGETPWLCRIPLCLTAAGCVLLFFFDRPIERFLEPITRVFP